MMLFNRSTKVENKMEVVSPWLLKLFLIEIHHYEIALNTGSIFWISDSNPNQ